MAAQKEKETHDQLVADSVKSAEDVARLTAENEELKSELAKVKSRYKTMRGLLEDAEVKSKAELAAEVLKLRTVKDEVVGFALAPQVQVSIILRVLHVGQIVGHWST